MLVLALETSTQHASAVLTDDDWELAVWREVCSRDLSRRLTAELQQVLKKADRNFQDLDLLSVGLGPGTFTGLRIGLATAKGIALARELPLVGVSSLLAMVWQMRDCLSGLVCPVLDARRGEFYTGFLRVTSGEIKWVEREFTTTAEGLLVKIFAQGEQVIMCGEVDQIPVEEIARAIGGHGKVWQEEAIVPDALAIAHLGRIAFERHGPDDLAGLRPIYVRASYAEEKSGIDLGLR